MKSIAVFFLLLFPLFASAQFAVIPSGTNAELTDVHFADSLNGIIVGDSGTILLTGDGGLSWNSITHGFGFTYFSRVRYIDRDNLLITGGNWNAGLFRSTDGGVTWFEITDSTQQNYFDIQVLNDSSAFVSGFPKNLIKTTDRGNSWQTIHAGDSSSDIQLLSFIDANTGFAAGWGGGSFNSFRKTTDGGANWSHITMNSGGDNVVLEAFHFFNASEGLYGGWYLANLRRTTNGGLDWTDVVPQDSLDEVQLLDLHFPDSMNGYASTWYGKVLKSTDQGVTWNFLVIPQGINAKLNGIWFHDQNHGWVVGSNGTILRTDNGGGTLGIVDTEQDAEINVWPIPARNEVKVSYPAGLKVYSTSILDVKGRKVFETDDRTEVICVYGWKPGMYFIRMQTSKGLITKRMPVE